MKRVPGKFIFMKVGQHAGEDFSDILERKRKEHKRTGMIFWGYGGNTLHPHNHVLPFIETYKSSGGIYLLMNPIKSTADPDIVPAKEYSQDLISWKKIPDGILVTGSRYALVLDDIEQDELELDLNDYQVGVGKSEGKQASKYLTGHIDKGCFVKSVLPAESDSKPKIRKVEYVAKLKSPYAVFLR
jgi:hypothetical protein